MFRPILIAALLLVPAIGFAAADTEGAKRPRAAHFGKADADGNGRLSRAEVAKSLPRLAREFDRIDSNKDGELSRPELSAWSKALANTMRTMDHPFNAGLMLEALVGQAKSALNSPH